MKIQCLLVAFVLVFPLLSTSQNQTDIFLRLIDSETSEPISFATVRFEGTTKGLIADYNGEFRIPASFKENPSNLRITSIGYKTLTISTQDLKVEGINVFELIPQVEVLDAVVITNSENEKVKPKDIIKKSRSLTAREIIQKAIDNIPVNLNSAAHSYIGYYRDYQIVDSKFHNLNEGIFETFDPGINTAYFDEGGAKTAVYSFKQNPDFKQDSDLTNSYNGITKYIEDAQIFPRGGNEHTILNTHNPIRIYNEGTFSFVYNFELDFLNNHKFKRVDVVYLNNEPICKITFKRKIIIDSMAIGTFAATNEVDGVLYISLADFSIHRFEYTCYKDYSKDVLFHVGIEYARQNDHMYLNYITFNNAFVVAEDFVLREERISYDNDQQAFYITFNNTKDLLDVQSISPRNFKFKFDKQRLKIISANQWTERTIRVNVERYDKKPLVISQDSLKLLSFTIKNIEDQAGREIYKRQTIEGDQFREFFVQEVKGESTEGLRFMDRIRPVYEAPLNTGLDPRVYWINSPLMEKKYRDEE